MFIDGMTPVEETNLPRVVLYRGSKVRVLGYIPASGDMAAKFVILDRSDSVVRVVRSQITFIKGA